VKAVRLGGAGRGFSSGGSISAEDLATAFSRPPADLIDAANRAVRAIVALPRPVVAAVNGPSVGRGASLALACEITLTLVSESSYFAVAAAKIGLMPDCGALSLIAAAVSRISRDALGAVGRADLGGHAQRTRGGVAARRTARRGC
jgi:enoyl-CoA hydratase